MLPQPFVLPLKRCISLVLSDLEKQSFNLITERNNEKYVEIAQKLEYVNFIQFFHDWCSSLECCFSLIDDVVDLVKFWWCSCCSYSSLSSNETFNRFANNSPSSLSTRRIVIIFNFVQQQFFRCISSAAIDRSYITLRSWEFVRQMICQRFYWNNLMNFSAVCWNFTTFDFLNFFEEVTNHLWISLFRHCLNTVCKSQCIFWYWTFSYNLHNSYSVFCRKFLSLAKHDRELLLEEKKCSQSLFKSTHPAFEEILKFFSDRYRLPMHTQHNR